MTSVRVSSTRPMSRRAVLSCALAWLPIVGLVFGLLALADTGPGGNRRGRSLAIAGLVLSAAFFFLPIYALVPWWS